MPWLWTLFLVLGPLATPVLAGTPWSDSHAGEWRFDLDPDDLGVRAEWFSKSLPNRIHLPGTTDLAGYGEKTEGIEGGYLSRRFKYVGPAWYQRDLEIPPSWAGREVELLLERVLWQSTVFIDGERRGSALDSLGTPHLHRLGKLTPGRHRLTIRVDNRMIHPLGDKGHCYTEHTQTIWNGIVGRVELRARGPVCLSQVRIFPDATARKISVEASVCNATGKPQTSTLLLAARRKQDGKLVAQIACPFQIEGADQKVTTELPLPVVPEVWSEFTPHLYTLEARVTGPGGEDRAETQTFGFRALGRSGTHFTVNGIPTFMRGNLESAIFPLTGHPPCEVESWRRIFRIYREHGLNQARFHSWCPPEAAFQAADELGIYLQVEVLWIDWWMSGPNPRKDMETPGYPKGVGKGDRTIDDYVRAETRRMLDAYGHHPSFVFFIFGNELGNSDFNVMGQWIKGFKAYDPRHYFAASSARTITPACDFQDTHNIPGVGSVVNALGRPRTDWDYESSYGRAPVPTIAHELGQMPVYPCWDELAKYTGPMQARNLESFHATARLAGIDTQDRQFQAASGYLNRILYKNEIEAQFRSPSGSGLNLLSMLDYSGQGEALVGWLDAFYEPKDFLTAKTFRRYCNTTVPLARFSKYVWTSAEVFSARAEVAHYGAAPLNRVSAVWKLRNARGKTVLQGQFPAANLPLGSVTTLGQIEIPLTNLPAPQRYNLELTLPGTAFANDWNLWIFPAAAPSPPPIGVLVTQDLDVAWRRLSEGGKVLLIAHQLGEKRHAGLAAFTPLFWSATFFPGQSTETLGAIVQDTHPALAHFPTSTTLDWQWQEVCAGAHGFLLDDLPKSYRQIVQPIHDFHYNHKLGSLFELKTQAGGRLLVCGYDILSKLDQRPAARQLALSLIEYAGSKAFQPTQMITESPLRKMMPQVKPATVAAPKGFEGAVLYVRAAARHPAQGNEVWKKAFDEVKTSEPGYDYQVSCDGIWKDGTGATWFGKKIKVEIKLPTAFLGDLYVRCHDWNHNGRRANLSVEGRKVELGPHTEATWVKLDVLREDANDGALIFEAECTSGPNLQITDLALVPRK
jgi:hypothetical protein